jgi:hypothetical protein
LDGFGPLSPATPVGGRVFVTSDSSASSIAWSEITPPANQSTFYTIGDIAVGEGSGNLATYDVDTTTRTLSKVHALEVGKCLTWELADELTGK